MLNQISLPNEVWKPYPEFPDRFLVSNKGRVLSIAFNKLKTCKTYSTTSKGYLSTVFSVNGKPHLRLVHRMVAMTFIPNPENKPHVNHINSNRADNNVDNLEWVTVKENIRHGREHGNITLDCNKGVKSPRAKSKYNNVTWNETKQRWQSSLKINGKRLSQKMFKTEEEAALFVNEQLDALNITDRPRNIL